MSAETDEEIRIRLNQNVGDEGKKAGAGLESMAAGFARVTAAAKASEKMKMPGLREGDRLKMLAKDADQAAAATLKLAAAQQASLAAAAKFAGVAADKAKAQSAKEVADRERAAMSAGLEQLKAASKEADAARARNEAAEAKAAARRQKAAEDEYQKAVALDKRRDKAMASNGESRLSKLFASQNKTPEQLRDKGGAPVISSFQKLLQGVENVFGKKAAGATAEAARGLAGVGDAYDKLGPAAQTLLKGAGVLAGAGVAVAAAAAALTIAAAVVAAKLLIRVAELSIEKSTFREAAQGALDRLTKGHGAETYDATMQIAAKLGLDKEDAVAQTKALLQAGLDKQSIPLALTAIADISIDLGDEKGNALKEKLAQFGHGKKIDAGAITGLAEAGVDANKVFEALRQKGESLDHVMARLKTNQVSSAEAIKAVLAAVESASGGAAAGKAKSIPGLLNAISIAFDHLFDQVDQDQAKGALGNVYAALTGPGGEKLKSSLTALGGQLFKTLLGPFQGDVGRERLEKFVAAITRLADKTTEVLIRATPYVESFINIATALVSGDAAGSDNPIVVAFSMIGDAAKIALIPVRLLYAAAKMLWDLPSLGGKIGADLGKSLAGGQADPAVAANATVAGGAVAAGLATGVTAGGPEISAAITQAAGDAVAAAKAALGIASPSKVFAGLGRFTALGFAQGVNDNSGVVADAGSAMAGSAVSGAVSAPGGSSASSSASVQINITIAPPAGASAAQVGEMAAAATDAGHAAWLANERKAKRDRGERTAA